MDETTPKVKARKSRSSSDFRGSKRRKIIAIGAMVVGLIMLVVGVTILVLNLAKMNQAADGDYLVSAGDWVLEGEEGVVWDFTEVGKGKLTTNGHLNDYDFIWAIEDGKLLIETDWLYTLENEYEYDLDQGAGVLTLTAGDETYQFTTQ